MSTQQSSDAGKTSTSRLRAATHAGHHQTDHSDALPKPMSFWFALSVMLGALYLPGLAIVSMMATVDSAIFSRLGVIGFLQMPFILIPIIASAVGVESLAFIAIPLFIVLVVMLASIGRANWGVMIILASLLITLSTLSAGLSLHWQESDVESASIEGE